MPNHLVGAFTSGEDARFFEHHGFDRTQIERSLGVNVQAGTFVRGGSTISQQLVKNVFLSPRRTLARKLQEAVLTWRLETHLSKRLIIERYLNIIELGEGVFGVEAAAQHWFGKPARRLGVAESAFLAALTPAPKTISRRVRAHGGVDPATRKRIEIILRSMRRNRVISAESARRATEQPLRLRVPKLASRP
jgi:penicillin-binding protein 1A